MTDQQAPREARRLRSDTRRNRRRLLEALGQIAREAPHGPVMVQLRSRKGFLERLHDGNETIVMAREAWRRPVEGLLADLGLPAQMLEHALFLNNMMYDPREIHDLLQEAGMSRREVTTHLTEAYLGALRGWARAG